MKYYSEEHEWVEVKGDVAVIGISEHAAEELGDITFVELPEVGASFKSGDTLGVIESVKAAADVYAPVSGEVVEVNEKLEDSPELINESAEEDGWICKMKNFDVSEVNALMNEGEYQEFLSNQG